MERVETDVLVVGRGSAGLCAAIAAAESGSRVLVVSKPGGNCTSVAAGGFATLLPHASEEARQQYVADAMASSAGLGNERLIGMLVERSAGALEKIMRWGVKFYTRNDGSLRPFRSGGHSDARTYRCLNGNAGQFLKILGTRAGAAGAVFLSGCTLAGCVTAGSRVTGAWGMNREGRPLHITCKAMVLAGGGFAGAYAHTTNPPGMTGDVLEMAFEAGCTLTDLEFVQFMPTTFAWPPELSGRLVNDTLRGDGARLLNGLGERFMDRYDLTYGDCAARDILSIAICQEVSQGRGTEHGGVYMDARALDKNRVAECLSNFRLVARHGVDPTRDMLEVAPAAHFTCGGVVVDTQCRTGIEGLYAAGEVVAGLHGANRLGGTALTETLVFGDMAGREAASYAGTVKNCAGGPCRLPEWAERCGRAGRGCDSDAAALASRIRDIFNGEIGILRSENELDQAVKTLLAAAEEAAELAGEGKSFAVGLRFEQARKMAMLGYKTALAAKDRAESRGAHFRADFPEERAVWEKHLYFHKESGTLSQ